MAAGILDTLSDDNLEKLCRLVFWLDPEARGRLWADDRDSRERFLDGIHVELVRDFQRFLELEIGMAVPMDHLARCANMPDFIYEKALNLEAHLFASQPRDKALAYIMTEDESTLVLRWLNWSGNLDVRNVWWRHPGVFHAPFGR